MSYARNSSSSFAIQGSNGIKTLPLIRFSPLNIPVSNQNELELAKIDANAVSLLEPKSTTLIHFPCQPLSKYLAAPWSWLFDKLLRPLKLLHPLRVKSSRCHFETRCCQRQGVFSWCVRFFFQGLPKQILSQRRIALAIGVGKGIAAWVRWLCESPRRARIWPLGQRVNVINGSTANEEPFQLDPSVFNPFVSSMVFSSPLTR